MNRRHRLHLQFDRFAGLYLWLTFIIVFGAWNPDLFFTTATLHGVASSNAAIRP